MGEVADPFECAPLECLGTAVPRRRAPVAPFMCGFLVALALYVSFSPLRVQATPNTPPVLEIAQLQLLFRDHRRLIDVSWYDRRGDTLEVDAHGRATMRRAVPAARALASPTMRLQQPSNGVAALSRSWRSAGDRHHMW